MIRGPDFIEREITQPTVCHLELLFQDNNNRILNFMKLLNILVFMSLVWAQDVLCSNKIEYYQNGNIEFCTLSSEDTLSGNRFLREQEFTSRRRVYLIGVSWSRIQESKSIYVEEVVMTL